MYKSLGFLSVGNLNVVTREDLVGQYLGETAIKTRTVLEESLGSVLFIDEAYSLGNTGREDMYAKECVDTLTAFLSENTKDFVCIVAGYSTELQKCFFDSNPGLDRRFPWKYEIKPYKPKELCEIFEKQLMKQKWKLRTSGSEKSMEMLETLIKENERMFTNNGGDVQNLINACMMAHSKRVFGSTRNFKRHLLPSDITKGFTIYKKNKKQAIQQQENLHMYL